MARVSTYGEPMNDSSCIMQVTTRRTELKTKAICQGMGGGGLFLFEPVGVLAADMVAARSRFWPTEERQSSSARPGTRVLRRGGSPAIWKIKPGRSNEEL